MSFENLLSDTIVVVSPDGSRSAPIKASVQGDKIIVFETSAVIEDGWKILRVLPNKREESYTVLQSNFINAPNERMSHYSVRVRKDTSLMPSGKHTTINITNSHSFQVGDGNTQQIIDAASALAKAVRDSDASQPEKQDAKSRLDAFLRHPVIVSLLGAAGKAALDKL
jgi:hypothetical protein